MASGNPLKRLWPDFLALKEWAESADQTNKKFHVLSSSFDQNSTMTPVSESNRAEASSSTQSKCVKITGLIYPLTEPFRQRALKVKIEVPFPYPHIPPVVFMRSRILHPNIDEAGRICSASLNQSMKWNPMTLSEVVSIVISLIDQPERSFVVNTEMGSLYDTNLALYNQRMMEMVASYGEPRI